MSDNKTEAPKTTKVRIFKSHTHAGKRIDPPAEGVEIEVTEKQATFLKRAGITDRPTTEQVPVPAGPVVTASKTTV